MLLDTANDKRGADLILGCRFDTGGTATQSSEVRCNGTTVAAVPIPPGAPGATQQSIADARARGQLTR